MGIKIPQTEQQILNAICDYLTVSNVPFVHVRNTGNIIRRDNRIFFGKTRNQKGAADIIACASGIPLSIEVKREKGVVSTDQQNWILRWIKEGGVAFVARSVDDVIEKINLIRKRIDTNG